MSKNYKVYGNEPTSLKLTEKAYATYASIDPLEIREYTDEDSNHTYDIIGAVDFHNLSAHEAQETLESLGSDHFTIDSFGSYLPENWEECLLFLNNQARGMDENEVSRLWEDFCLGRLEVKPAHDVPNVTWKDIKASASNTAENSDRFDLSKSLAQNYMDSIDINGGSVTVIQDPANGDAYVTYFVNDFEEADCFISIEKLRTLLPELPQYIA